MLIRKSLDSRLVFLALFITMMGMAFVGEAQAQACRDKENSACSQDSSCSWVSGYTRSDGAKVSAFCRAKPKRANNSASAEVETKP